MNMLRHSKSPSNLGTPAKKTIYKHVPDTLCQYKPRPCHHAVLDQYKYCLKHILEDKNAPYKPCGYAYPINNKRCLIPAPRGENFDGYCSLHSWSTQSKNQRTGTRHIPLMTPEYLLSGLSRYVRNPRAYKTENEINTYSKVINPFEESEINKVSSSTSRLLECASDSDSDVEPATLDNIWKGTNEDSSDAESIDSQLDDPLSTEESRYPFQSRTARKVDYKFKSFGQGVEDSSPCLGSYLGHCNPCLIHAGFYTSEEVFTISRNKLVRLQTLYHKQFERLSYLLKEKRRRYLFYLKKEKESLSSIHDQAKTSAKEQKLYEKLKFLNGFHRRSKAESVAYFQSIEKKGRLTGGPHFKSLVHSCRCVFTEGGVRCSKVTLPLTKFCLKHILEDSNQCLFRACGCIKGDASRCQETVFAIQPSENCILHMKLPLLPHFNNNILDSLIKMDLDGDKKSMDGSEIDASATESAFSTDNRDSPESSIIHGEEITKLKGDLIENGKDNYNGVSEIPDPLIDDPKMELDLGEIEMDSKEVADSSAPLI